MSKRISIVLCFLRYSVHLLGVSRNACIYSALHHSLKDFIHTSLIRWNTLFRLKRQYTKQNDDDDDAFSFIATNRMITPLLRDQSWIGRTDWATSSQLLKLSCSCVHPCIRTLFSPLTNIFDQIKLHSLCKPDNIKLN